MWGLYKSIRQSFQRRKHKTQENMHELHYEFLDIGSIRDLLAHRERLYVREERFSDENKSTTENKNDKSVIL